jgi:hypothetical protein
MADPVEIPVALDTPLYTQRVTLDGREYQLRFDFAEREDRWYLSILDVTGNMLASGIKLVGDWPLVRTHLNPALPQGLLIAADFSPLEGAPPGFSDLGRRVLLVYIPKG